MRKKRGQGWGFDAMVASMIFTVALTTFYLFAINYGKSDQNRFDDLARDANVLADTVLTEGVPANWDQTNVVAIGIITNNKINETKLKNWYDLAQANYPATRVFFSTSVNYFVNLSDQIYINDEPVEGIGLKPQENKTVFRVSRFTTYREKPVTLYVVMWS